MICLSKVLAVILTMGTVIAAVVIVAVLEPYFGKLTTGVLTSIPVDVEFKLLLSLRLLLDIVISPISTALVQAR